MKRLTWLSLLIIPFILCTSWGFFAHKRINQLAIFTLPIEMINFYKAGSGYIIDHAVDPDKRRYIDTLEAPRHYLDVENYEEQVDSIPEKWVSALNKYGQKKLNASGIVPWQIERSYYSLVKAFKTKDSLKILKYSADLGHYIGAFDVAINPQLLNELTRGNYPRKIDEYLAMGKPVVATKTDFMDFFKEYCYLAEGKESFVKCLEQALAEDTPERHVQRIAFAHTHSWEMNVEQIYKLAAAVL